MKCSILSAKDIGTQIFGTNFQQNFDHWFIKSNTEEIIDFKDIWGMTRNTFKIFVSKFYFTKHQENFIPSNPDSSSRIDEKK